MIKKMSYDRGRKCFICKLISHSKENLTYLSNGRLNESFRAREKKNY